MIRQNLVNIPGWRTKRKIVVIESDDWGSIRMSSKAAVRGLSKNKYDFSKDLYSKYDSLASEDDLSLLFDTLDSVNDKNGNSAILTANTIMANPDFDKIKEGKFKKYHFEPFTETLKEYPSHRKSFNIWKEGMIQKVFHPQFHGREHINVSSWMGKLRSQEKWTTLGFDYKTFSLKSEKKQNNNYSDMRALNYCENEEIDFLENSIREGLKLFKDIFGYNSKSFIAPSYVWDHKIENILSEGHVKYLQGIRFQYEPNVGMNTFKKKVHFLGRKNKFDQTYLIRNVFFEPTLLGKNNVVENTLSKISTVFQWNKPVILSSHRINFIGFLDENNRTQNLKLFKNLLNKIVATWPEVEFLTSDQLGDLINKEKNNSLIL